MTPGLRRTPLVTSSDPVAAVTVGVGQAAAFTFGTDDRDTNQSAVVRRYVPAARPAGIAVLGTRTTGRRSIAVLSTVAALLFGLLCLFGLFLATPLILVAVVLLS